MKIKSILYTIIVLAFLSVGYGCSNKPDPALLDNPTPSSLTFDNLTDQKEVKITNKGEDNLVVTIAPDKDWITVSPSTLTINKNESKNFTVSINSAITSYGTYTANITITGKSEELDIPVGDKTVDVTLNYVAGNEPPEATFSVSPESGSFTTEFIFDATNSHDPEGQNLEYKWIWSSTDSTAWLTTKTISHYFSTVGVNVVTLKVKDGMGAVGKDTKNITIIDNKAPTPVLTVSTTAPYYVGSQITFDASQSSDDNTITENLRFAWKINDGSYSTPSSTNIIIEDFSTTGEHTVYVKVIDEQDLEAETSTTITISPMGLPNVTTIGINDNNSVITHNSAVLKGELNSFGGGADKYTAYGFCWSATNNNPTIGDVNCNYLDLGESNFNVPFEHVISGLDPETTYYFRAYASNSQQTGYGVTLNFQTKEWPIPPNIVTTNDILNLLPTSVTGTGSVLEGNGVSFDEVGHQYSTDINFSGANLIEGNLNGTNFTTNITGLNEDTDYYIRAYAIINGVTFFGNIRNFSTPGNN